MPHSPLVMRQKCLRGNVCYKRLRRDASVQVPGPIRARPGFCCLQQGLRPVARAGLSPSIERTVPGEEDSMHGWHSLAPSWPRTHAGPGDAGELAEAADLTRGQRF